MPTSTSLGPFFDCIVAWSFDRPLPRTAQYGLTALLIGAVALIRATFVTDLVPWLLFIPAILITALVFGEACGRFASLFAAFLAALAIGGPANPMWLTVNQWLASGLFLIVVFGIVALAAALRAALRRHAALNKHLAERERFMASVLTASTDCIKVIELDGTLSFMSEGGRKVMEIDDLDEVFGCPWTRFWEGEETPKAQAALDAARQGRTEHFIGQAKTARGTEKHWSVSVSPIAGPDGRVERILSVSRDHSDLVAAREQQELLNAELGHRLKNMLAIIQSIANQTFKTAHDLPEAGRHFAARLASLGEAADVLTRGAWKSATFSEVVAAGLTSVEGLADRIVIDGPDIQLSPQTALALTLALHELVTNATKYGALSNEIGRVEIIWSVDADDRFRFTWRESGGPPVEPPTRQGFGSRMIERSLRSYFKGPTELAFAPEGVTFTIDAPLAGAGTLIKAHK